MSMILPGSFARQHGADGLGVAREIRLRLAAVGDVVPELFDGEPDLLLDRGLRSTWWTATSI